MEHPAVIISTDKSLMDKQQIHAFLSQTYWSPQIPFEILSRAIDNSFCVAALLEQDGHYQVLGFARMITDCATFAYLADVFVIPEYRGQGISRKMMDELERQPELQNLRRTMLVTRDAHGLYAKYGYQVAATPDRIMEKLDPGVYQRLLAQTAPEV